MRLELTTACLSDRNSDHLNYPPMNGKNRIRTCNAWSFNPSLYRWSYLSKKENHLPLSDKWLNYAKLSFPAYTAYNPHTLIKTRQIIQFLMLHQNWIFCICLNCLIISVVRIVSFLLLYYLSSGNRIWTGNLRVMGPAIFHLIISRDWKRQIRTAPHAPRARVLPLHHVLIKSDYEGNWTLTPRETIWYANHYATQPYWSIYCPMKL